MALVNRYGLKRTQIPIAPFSSLQRKIKVRVQQRPPLNCNINPVVGEINPLRPRVEDYGTSTKLGGNADVRALYLSL